MCPQKLTDASLIYRTEPDTKTEKKRTKTIINTGYAQKIYEKKKMYENTLQQGFLYLPERRRRYRICSGYARV